MGVRVHKVIGFATDTFASTPEHWSRFSKIGEDTVDMFAGWCREHKDDIIGVASDWSRAERLGFDWDLDALVEYLHIRRDYLGRFIHGKNSLSGKGENILLLIPLTTTPRWNRYNDDIDWAEETQFHEQSDRLCFLERELHPYAKGRPPILLAAMLLRLGVPELWGTLREALYVYWS